MIKDFDLKALEKKAWISTFRDGLLDIFLGLMFLVISFRPFLDDIGISRPWDAIISTMLIFSIVLFYIVGKKFITIPRIGLVKFGPKRKARSKKLFVIIAIFIVVTNIILILEINKTASLAHLTGLALYMMRFGIGLLLLGLPISLIAYFMEIKRLYLIAVLVAVAESVYGYVGSIGFIVTGGIILLTGLVIFIRFLRDYPLPSEGNE